MLSSHLGRKTVRRNPLIAGLLHRIEFIEKAGTGIRRMREEAERHGSPAPAFEATGFLTTSDNRGGACRAQSAWSEEVRREGERLIMAAKRKKSGSGTAASGRIRGSMQ
jgi:predicted HTH transcriptional regulator